VWTSYVVVDGVVVWFTVLIGALLGRLTYGAVAISSFCVQLAALVASVVLFVAIARRNGWPVHWAHLVRVLGTPAATAYAIVGVVSAVAGLFVIRRVAPKAALRS
jgi:hypothetical protein